MGVEAQIEAYLSRQQPAKRDEMRDLWQRILRLSPGCRLWFLDGRNEQGKVVSNPNIGVGSYEIVYAGGETREFYQVGLSANTSGISVYVMDTPSKTYLAETYGAKIGKASVSGYCVKFRSLKDIDTGVLEAMIAECMARSAA